MPITRVARAVDRIRTCEPLGSTKLVVGRQSGQGNESEPKQRASNTKAVACFYSELQELVVVPRGGMCRVSSAALEDFATAPQNRKATNDATLSESKVTAGQTSKTKMTNCGERHQNLDIVTLDNGPSMTKRSEPRDEGRMILIATKRFSKCSTSRTHLVVLPTQLAVNRLRRHGAHKPTAQAAVCHLKVCSLGCTWHHWAPVARTTSFQYVLLRRAFSSDQSSQRRYLAKVSKKLFSFVFSFWEPLGLCKGAAFSNEDASAGD